MQTFDTLRSLQSLHPRKSVRFEEAPQIRTFWSCHECLRSVLDPRDLGKCNVSCPGHLCSQCKDKYCGLCSDCFEHISDTMTAFELVLSRLDAPPSSPVCIVGEEIEESSTSSTSTLNSDESEEESDEESDDDLIEVVSSDGYGSDDVDATTMANTQFNYCFYRRPAHRAPPIARRRDRVTLRLIPDQFGNVDVKLTPRRSGRIASRHTPGKRAHIGSLNPLKVRAHLNVCRSRKAREAGKLVNLVLTRERVSKFY